MLRTSLVKNWLPILFSFQLTEAITFPLSLLLTKTSPPRKQDQPRDALSLCIFELEMCILFLGLAKQENQ
jgi:sigma54-dependent transcription regulator